MVYLVPIMTSVHHKKHLQRARGLAWWITFALDPVDGLVDASFTRGRDGRRCTMGRRQVSRGSVMVCSKACSEAGLVEGSRFLLVHAMSSLICPECKGRFWMTKVNLFLAWVLFASISLFFWLWGLSSDQRWKVTNYIYSRYCNWVDFLCTCTFLSNYFNL